MIPLEKQVCSLELSKRLKELGVKQESLFYWVRDNDTEEFHLTHDRYAERENWSTSGLDFSAFTIEVGE
jgi:hypothetical protein